MKKRFEVIYKEGTELSDSGSKQILVDTETGATYLYIKSGYAGGITPLLDCDGQPVITYLGE